MTSAGKAWAARICLICSLLPHSASILAAEESQWNSFAPAVQRRLQQQGVNAASFVQWREQVAGETDHRERDGEGDHLVHYALLSRSFTRQAPVEPALSAKEFVESGGIPQAALLRMQAFEKALRTGGPSERLKELRLIANGRDLRAEYARAMRVLYAKEFQHEGIYTRRGHSTDTSVAANYAVWHGLQVLAASDPSFHINRVLVIGPGLDFAPRTGLLEIARPQSYQPFAILDALLALGNTPSVHCFDINPRVIRFFQSFPALKVLELQAAAGDQAYMAYFRQVGTKLGRVDQRSTTEKTITVKADLAQRITAERHNIVTDGPAPGYDLVIATNVLLYYEGAQLTVALANIAQSLTPGGYFLHNDLRPELDSATQAAGLNALAARTIRISATTFDSFALYRR